MNYYCSDKEVTMGSLSEYTLNEYTILLPEHPNGFLKRALVLLLLCLRTWTFQLYMVSVENTACLTFGSGIVYKEAEQKGYCKTGIYRRLIARLNLGKQLFSLFYFLLVNIQLKPDYKIKVCILFNLGNWNFYRKPRSPNITQYSEFGAYVHNITILIRMMRC